MNAKTLLIVCGGIEAIPGIQLAKKMGLHVVVSDNNPDAPGFKYADEALIASTYDADATVAAAEYYHKSKKPIDGVMCMAADVPLTVARVASALQLPGISIEAAKLATHKLLMKDCFAEHNIAIPWYTRVESVQQLEILIKQKGLPLIIKPVDSRGGRGVIRITKDISAEFAFNQALKHSPSKTVILEKYLDGQQVSTESIIVNGTSYTPGYSDRNYEYLEKYAPYVIENGGNLPTLLPDNVLIKINTLIEKVAASLDIRDGVIKGDIVFHNNEPHVIEVAARLSGGFFCSHEIPLNTGVSTIKAVIQQALGEVIDPRDLKPRYMHAVSQRYIFPTPGKVIEVSGVDLARDIIGVEEVIIKARPGDIIESPTNSNGWAGMVIAVGDTRDQADKHVFDAIRTINIKTEPV